MGIKQILVDDLDGRDLPEDTQPLTVTVDGKKHSVYMSARNTERFMDFLTGAKPLTGAGSFKPPKGRSAGGRSSEELAEIRTWAKANGHTVGEKGRIAASVIEAYEAR